MNLTQSPGDCSMWFYKNLEELDDDLFLKSLELYPSAFKLLKRYPLSGRSIICLNNLSGNTNNIDSIAELNKNESWNIVDCPEPKPYISSSKSIVVTSFPGPDILLEIFNNKTKIKSYLNITDTPKPITLHQFLTDSKFFKINYNTKQKIQKTFENYDYIITTNFK